MHSNKRYHADNKLLIIGVIHNLVLGVLSFAYLFVFIVVAAGKFLGSLLPAHSTYEVIVYEAAVLIVIILLIGVIHNLVGVLPFAYLFVFIVVAAGFIVVAAGKFLGSLLHAHSTYEVIVYGVAVLIVIIFLLFFLLGARMHIIAILMKYQTSKVIISLSADIIELKQPGNSVRIATSEIKYIFKYPKRILLIWNEQGELKSFCIEEEIFRRKAFEGLCNHLIRYEGYVDDLSHIREQRKSLKFTPIFGKYTEPYLFLPMRYH